MPDHDESDDVEFDGGGGTNTEDEELPTPTRRGRRSTTVFVGLAVLALVLGIAIRQHQEHSPHDRLDASSSPAPTRRVSAVPVAEATIDDPPSAALAAVAAVCRTAPTCTPRPGTNALQRSARHALGRLQDLQTRTVPGVATIVAARATDGAQLLAIATRQNTIIDPATLGIHPPIGVQSQRNGPDRLVVVVSGTVDAVALLSRHDIQTWLVALRAG